MRKPILLVLIALIFCANTKASTISLDEIRMEFYKITINSKNTPNLLQKLYDYPNPDAVVLAYTAATEAIMAKVAWNPYSKFNYLFKSKDTFEKAISKNKTNVEIRFLRFSVEHHLPKYLGMSKNMQKDKNVILKEMKVNSVMSMDDEMLNYTMRFLINSKQCSEAELKKIKFVLAKSQIIE